MIKRIGLGFIGVVLVAVLYFFLWPVALDPIAWTPPLAPLPDGVYKPNTALSGMTRLETGGAAPESVAVDGRGRIYTGLADGRIVRLTPNGGSPEVVTRTGGRPLGLAFDQSGNLIVCDLNRGLLSVSTAGVVEPLTRTGRGPVPGAANSLAIAADGRIYFSDSSASFRDTITELMGHRPNGRLLCFNPLTGLTRLVLEGLYYANGVALGPGDGFVLVVETAKYRVLRHWLRGPAKGRTEVFIDNLPGYPDGICPRRDGGWWVALVAPRQEKVDRLLLPRPWLRRMMMRLPGFLLPKGGQESMIVGLGPGGGPGVSLQGAPEDFGNISAVIEAGGRLYLGSLTGSGVGLVELD